MYISVFLLFLICSRQFEGGGMDMNNLTLNVLNASDSVMVDNVTGKSEIDLLVQHFSELYPINDWIENGYFRRSYLYEINPHWLSFPPQSHMQYYGLAFGYTLIMICGVTGNFFVIFLFFRTKSLRTPANILIVNLACSDLLMMLKMPIFIYNCLHYGPALGDYVCRIYGFIGGISGTCSICTITAISLDRYYVIKYPLKNRFSSTRAKTCVLLAWIYSGFFAGVPLFNTKYGKYTPEGFLTSCSFDYLSENVSAQAFIWAFGIAAFVVPFLLITYFYSSILRVVVYKKHPSKNHNLSGRESHRHMKQENKKRQEMKVTIVVLSVIITWFAAWTPYTVIAFLGVCGQRELITPLVSMIPALFCKSAAVTNPFLYALIHPKFREELQHLCRCHKDDTMSRIFTGRSSYIVSNRNFTQSLRMQQHSTRITNITTSSRIEVQDRVEREEILGPDVSPKKKFPRRHWWYKPSFINRSGSWRAVTRTLSRRSASIEMQERNCDSVEEIPLGKIHF